MFSLSPGLLWLSLLGACSWLLASASAPAATADALAGKRCISGEEDFVPGDFYYCLASQSYGQGRYHQARRFFERAAGWASKPAEYVLGLMAFNGDQQPVNRPLGLAWLALAAERNRSDFVQTYEAAKQRASASEIAASQSLLAKMRLRYADTVAAPRAEKRYRDGMNKLAHIDNGNGRYCMQGMLDSAQLGGGVSIDPAHCPSVQAIAQAVDQSASQLLAGWRGHVEIGILREAKALPPVAKTPPP